VRDPRRRRLAWGIVFTSVLVLAGGVLAYLVLVGAQSTLRAGTQSSICGVQVGVTGTDETVRLTWTDGGETLAEGERTRVTAWCAIEVESIDGSADEGEDGGGATITVRWRLG
jgi:hypothetical protein